MSRYWIIETGTECLEVNIEKPKPENEWVLWNFILKESTVVSGDPSENTSVNIAQK